jgi:hypothetical protein
MEHKWALFCHEGQILFVRSWQRAVKLIAEMQQGNGTVELSSIQGTLVDPNEDPAFTEAAVDFIIRTHALRSIFPAPLPSYPGSELQKAAKFSFGLFGNFAQFATHHRCRTATPGQPLRSHSLFHLAIARNDLAMAQTQLDRGVPVDLLAGDGLTAMHWALATQNLGTLDWLAAHGMPVDVRSDQGATPLMNAVQGDNRDAVGWFLSHGADPNASDYRGFTSLHRAAELGHVSIARLLLEGGAQRDPTAEGHAPLSLARFRGNHEIAGLLEE